mmetsp:Transcript_52648/g.157716  ORF Transcript_52648/g.157716 Transcript_52648/m.157716 type:complete len:222 (+) Transcript_52648:585-1250(+)
MVNNPTGASRSVSCTNWSDPATKYSMPRPQTKSRNRAYLRTLDWNFFWKGIHRPSSIIMMTARNTQYRLRMESAMLNLTIFPSIVRIDEASMATPARRAIIRRGVLASVARPYACWIFPAVYPAAALTFSAVARSEMTVPAAWSWAVWESVRGAFSPAPYGMAGCRLTVFERRVTAALPVAVLRLFLLLWLLYVYSYALLQGCGSCDGGEWADLPYRGIGQ